LEGGVFFSMLYQGVNFLYQSHEVVNIGGEIIERGKKR
jgi:hypothetical protein